MTRNARRDGSGERAAGEGGRRPLIRWRRVGIVLALVTTVGGLVLSWMTTAPGPTRGRGAPTVGSRDMALVAELTSDVCTLADTIGERNVHWPEQLHAAQAHIEGEFRRAGFEPWLEEYEILGVRCANVAIDVPGRDPSAGIVVIGAHYDSFIGSPGANDNATGVASMLAIARRVGASLRAGRPPFERTLRFVAFVNEEPPWFETPWMGSRVHVAGAQARGDRIEAMLSLETLGCYTDEEDSQRFPSTILCLAYPTRGNFVAFVSDLTSRDLTLAVTADFRDVAAIPSESATFPVALPGIGWSDHRSFWLAGWPAVMVTDTAVFRDDHYHRASDRAGEIDYVRLARVVQGLQYVVARLASPRSDGEAP